MGRDAGGEDAIHQLEQQLATRLSNVRRIGSGVVAACPNHPNGNGVLTVRRTEDGRLGARCDAGCPYDSVVATLVGCGLRAAELVPVHVDDAPPTNHDRLRSTPLTDLQARRSVPLSEISPAAEETHGLWPGRLERGELTLLAGAPFGGKTSVALYVAATISKRGRWPDGGRAPVGSVLLLAAEDRRAEIVKRLKALGADLRRIHLWSDGLLALATGADQAKLEDEILRTGADLVVIDPLGVYLGLPDTDHDAAVHRVLVELAERARRRGAAILAVRHTGKGRRPPLDRILGSTAFTAVARIVLIVDRDPDQPDVRILHCPGSNLGPPAPALAFTLRAPNGSDIVVPSWRKAPVDDTTIQRVLAVPEDPTQRMARQEATAFLRKRLASGQVRSTEILREAAGELDFSKATLRRARWELGVRCFRRDGHWWMALDQPQKGPRKASKALTRDGVSTLWQAANKKGEVPRTSSKVLRAADVSTLPRDGAVRHDGADAQATG